MKFTCAGTGLFLNSFLDGLVGNLKREFPIAFMQGSLVGGDAGVTKGGICISIGLGTRAEDPYCDIELSDDGRFLVLTHKTGDIKKICDALVKLGCELTEE